MKIASVLEEQVMTSKSSFFYVDLRYVSSVIKNLKFVYHSIIASEQLLLCAIQQLRAGDSDLYTSALLAYYEEHLEEERNHVQWLADDLRAHGVELAGFDTNAAAMTGSQYYMLFHKHPSCLLGYLAVVEGVPTPITEIEKAESVYGKKLFRFARFHAVKDQEHKMSLFAIIDQTPENLVEGLITSADVTLMHMRRAASSWNRRDMIPLPALEIHDAFGLERKI